MKESKFTGTMWGLIGVRILSSLMTFFTLGIGFPWAIAYKQRWIVKHQIVDGNRLIFKGTGAQLFGNYIKWFLLSIVTFGIYSLWLPIKIQQWVTKHTHIRTEEDDIQASNAEKIAGTKTSQISTSTNNNSKIATILWLAIGIYFLIIKVSQDILSMITSQRYVSFILVFTSLVYIGLIGVYLFLSKSKGIFIALIIIGIIKTISIDLGLLLLLDPLYRAFVFSGVNFSEMSILAKMMYFLSLLLVYVNYALLTGAVIFSIKSQKPNLNIPKEV